MKDFHITTFRLPRELYDRLRAQAAIEGKSITRLVEESCATALSDKEQSGEAKRRVESLLGRVSAAGSVL